MLGGSDALTPAEGRDRRGQWGRALRTRHVNVSCHPQRDAVQTDVIIFPNSGLAGRAWHENLGPRLDTPVDLGHGVELRKLPVYLAEQIIVACKPQGYYPRPARAPVRNWGQLYTFVRENPPVEPPLQWDADRRLQECIAISRLVRPTSIGFEYAATLRYTPAGELASIFPGPVGGFGAQSWIVPTGYGDLLDEDDIGALRDLWSRADLSSLPDRLKRALWYHEYAARTNHIAVRWVLLTTGVEALINTKSDDATRQFIVRFSALARNFGRIAMSHTRAERIYDLRSKIAHGEGLPEFTDPRRQLYSELEMVLRLTLRASLNDPAAQQLFSSSDEVERQLPLDTC